MTPALPWWRRWDGFPPSAAAWRAAAGDPARREGWMRRALLDEAPPTWRGRGWRRWFVTGWLWPPFAVAALQLPLALLAAMEPDQDRWEVGLRAFLLLWCVVWALPLVVSRSAPGPVDHGSQQLLPPSSPTA